MYNIFKCSNYMEGFSKLICKFIDNMTKMKISLTFKGNFQFLSFYLKLENIWKYYKNVIIL